MMAGWEVPLVSSMVAASDNLQEKTLSTGSRPRVGRGAEKTKLAEFESPRPPFPRVRSLLWDGEHRFPNNVGPEKLSPTEAWEIHPIKRLAER
jgi:hypothetical protein